MADESGFQLKFWGVRGSTPTPNTDCLGYGGNTTCMEILGQYGERIIIDAGTGIRELGRKLDAETTSEDVNLFLTHFHWDHIQGIPFFAPLLKPGIRVMFHSFPASEEIRARLERQMSSPYFTLDFNAVGAEREFIQTENAWTLGSLSVTSFPLHHPQGACGYRIQCGEAAVVVASDFEHGNRELDRVLRENAEGADVLVYDAQYTPAEYATRCGWGHSTYSEAVKVARDAGVKKLVLFHHDPTHNDATVADIVKESGRLFPNTIAAQEQLVIRVKEADKL
jgi:phosphoribosyl 1,2-cyclic phosphodiesterase